MGSKIYIWLILAPCLLFGFRVIPRVNTWDIDNSSATSSKLFVVYENPTTAIENDLPNGDSLAGTATVTIQQVMNSVMSDFNNVAGSFVTLVDSNDTDFATRGTGRTITIRDGSSIGLTSGGYAKPTFENGIMTSCEIVLTSPFFETAEKLTRGVTHEMGHCLGLNHPMDTVHAVMSFYYESRPTFRLQIDDKMGLVYLYPVDKSGSKEEATYGFSCERK